MGLWQSEADTDIPVFWVGDLQPARRSIMIKADWTAPIAANNYDWTRIVAVIVDEPYVALENAPYSCSNASTRTAVSSIDSTLAARAAELRALAPRARFWVNFTRKNVEWMWDLACSNSQFENHQYTLIKSYMDVISLDAYWQPFVPTPDDAGVEAYNDWLADNRVKSDQQLALIAGTFYRPGVDSPSVQASYLPGYFDCVENANQNCNLPLGSRGRTDNFDGCPVWIVLGWLAGYTSDDNYDYIGELDPSSGPIRGVWRGQLALPLRSDLARQITHAQIIPAILSPLLD